MTDNKLFEMKHNFFKNKEFFTETTAPKWLKGNGSKSTTDNRWFWNDIVNNLKIDESVNTDFNTITRIK